MISTNKATPVLNDSLIEYSRKHSENMKDGPFTSKKHKANASSIKQLSIEKNAFHPQSRPKSSQSLHRKKTGLKCKAAKIRTVYRDPKPNIVFQQILHNVSTEKQKNIDVKHSIHNKSMQQSTGITEPNNGNSIKGKGAIFEPKKSQSVKRGTKIRKQLITDISPTKAFPKELDMINRIIKTEKHKILDMNHKRQSSDIDSKNKNPYKRVYPNSSFQE